MKELLEQYQKGNGLHHAYVVVGDSLDAVSHIEEIACLVFDSKKEELLSNPDFLISRANVFGIDESRILKERQIGKSFSGKKRIFVCQVNFMTREAQNALLKTLEEPSSDNHFFFIVPTLDMFLPTLLSRVSVLEMPVKREISKSEEGLVLEFLSGSVKNRIEILDELSDKNPEETRFRLINFLDQIERFVSIRPLDNLRKNELTIPKFVWAAKKDLMLTGSSPRLIAENLSISLPKIV